MIVKGYKAFDKQLKNRYGQQFEVGKDYDCLGKAIFGNKGNGYHFCQRLEDTLRYFDGMNDKIQIAEVIGSGNVVECCDEYNGYYDMYVATSIKIVRVLSRKEIIEYFLDVPDYRIKRFIQGYKLNKKEIDIFKEKYGSNVSILKTIAYYQENQRDIYNDCKILK